jgi:GntR family transcriptional regulator / MocR family aminotransferase
MNAPVTRRKAKAKIAYSRSRSRWADFLDLTVDSKSETPLLQQVYLLLRTAILSHALTPGNRLPSTRQLADRLCVSRTSVLSAYDQLLAEGYVEGRTGSGTYVTQDVPQPIIAPLVPAKSGGKTANRCLSNAGTRFRKIAKTLGAPDNIPFNTGCASVDAITIET